ncbi:MAG: Type secretory pathway VirD4 protein-like protein [Solirubrobacterales bacterium]|nr:Type secretory pathway VirD4 protein-like protein [Solirubrobacterales bacterium]
MAHARRCGRVPMRVERSQRHSISRRLLGLAAVMLLAALLSGVFAWGWTQLASMLELRPGIRLPLADAGRTMWRLLLHGGWETPADAFPSQEERTTAPAVWAYLVSGSLTLLAAGTVCTWSLRLRRRLSIGSPLGHATGTLARHSVDRGWVAPRTWAAPRDLQRLWVAGPVSGRPYLGWCGRRPARKLAAELEVQPMVVAPPRAGKTSGFVIPWLLDHHGPALVLSTKRDVHEATVDHRERLGEVWVYDPFGDERSAGFTPLVPARTWPGAIRTGEALASAAHPDASNAANEFWDKEAASMLAPLLHAAAIARREIGELVRWLDARDFTEAIDTLKETGAPAAADQLEGVSRRDERNRETTVMSALNLLRAYRYPQVAGASADELRPNTFLNGDANTAYVVAAGHDQEALRPVLLSLLTAIYEAAIVKGRAAQLEPRLLIVLDEAANIAPVRNLASWLSQCGDHGIVIATIWQSIAQIDQRYGRPTRDAICAASTAQLFLPPLADPTTTGYLNDLLGEETVSSVSRSTGGSSEATGQRKAAPTRWLRQIGRGRAILIYRDLPPVVVRAPGWFEAQGGRRALRRRPH